MTTENQVTIEWEVRATTGEGWTSRPGVTFEPGIKKCYLVTTRVHPSDRILDGITEVVPGDAQAVEILVGSGVPADQAERMVAWVTEYRDSHGVASRDEDGNIDERRDTESTAYNEHDGLCP